jgi:hypothetical protein
MAAAAEQLPPRELVGTKSEKTDTVRLALRRQTQSGSTGSSILSKKKKKEKKEKKGIVFPRMGSWPFASAPGHVVSPTASKKVCPCSVCCHLCPGSARRADVERILTSCFGSVQDLNKIYYGHSLMIGTGAGRSAY